MESAPMETTPTMMSQMNVNVSSEVVDPWAL